MTLIDTDRAEELYAAMVATAPRCRAARPPTRIAGVASFGGRAAYIGRVRDDELGTVFAHDLKSLGVTFTSPPRHRRAAHRALHDRRHPRRASAR